MRRAKAIAAGRSIGHVAREAQPEELTKVLPFLFAVRWGAWFIAWVIVWVGHLSKVNSEHEPVLLAITFAEILAATLYVPFLRSPVRKAFGARLGPRDDLIALGLLGVAIALVVTYFSGGWSSPYYHYGLASLLVPAFLLGWRRSVMLLIGFLAAYFAVLSTAGRGLDGTWVDEDIAAIIMTPALVIVVVQYLAQLTRRLDQQRAQAQRALLETSALYNVAQTVATADRPETLVAQVVETLDHLGRFEGLAVFSVGEGGRLSLEAGFGAIASLEVELSEDQLETLSQPDGVVRLQALMVPVRVQDKLLGVIAWQGRGDDVEQADLRLVRAVAGQLSLGFDEDSAQPAERGAGGARGTRSHRQRNTRWHRTVDIQAVVELGEGGGSRARRRKAGTAPRGTGRPGKGGAAGGATLHLRPEAAARRRRQSREHHPCPDARVQRRLRATGRSEGGRAGANGAACRRKLVVQDYARGAGQRLPPRRGAEHRSAPIVQRREALAGDPR